jgi:uncharacterized protein YciI
VHLFYPPRSNLLNVFANKDKISIVALEQMIQSGTLPTIKEELFMWYVIHASDREDSLEARKAARPAHLERVQKLIGQGRLLVAGPMPNIDSPDPGPAGFSGSTIIAEFESLDDARQWAATDPYVEAGVYEYVDVRPFIKALP